jgi:hypothetical protein
MVGYVARMSEIGNAYKILVVNSEKRDLFEDQNVSGRMMINWIVK